MTPSTLRLEQFQEWMQAIVAHPDGAAAGADSVDARALAGVGADDIEALCEPSSELSGLQRIGIYARMYYSRLVEILEKDFPAVQYALGEDCFIRYARGYVHAHPSRHFSLNVFGRHFAAFLRDEAPDVPHREFVAELAELQWAMQTVFDAPRAEPMSVDALLNVPPDGWDSTGLRLVPAHRLLAFANPVNGYLQSHRDEQEPGIPRDRSPSWVLVHRRHLRVWREDLDLAQYTLLRSLADGRSLGDALAAAVEADGAQAESGCPAGTERDAGLGGYTNADPGPGGYKNLEQVGDWFRGWAAHGLFAAVERR